MNPLPTHFPIELLSEVSRGEASLATVVTLRTMEKRRMLVAKVMVMIYI